MSTNDTDETSSEGSVRRQVLNTVAGKDDSSSSEPKVNRRRVLQTTAALSTASVAGCFGNGDDDDTGPGEQEREEVDTDDLPEEPTGTLEFALERSDFDNYDPFESSLADDSIVFNVIYDGLNRLDPEGDRFEWMAEEYEVVGTNDVSKPDDYVDYMSEYEIVDDEGAIPLLDVEWPNTILAGMYDPEDLEAYAAGDLTEGDSFRALSRDDAAEAAEDGVFGVEVRGRLHEGITFHNGEECTAGNVVDSYNRLVGSVNEGQFFDSFLHAEAPEGEDGYEFVLYGQEADAAAITELPPLYVVPSEHADIEPGEFDPTEDDELIGTGPYEVEVLEAGDELLLTRNDDYWVDEVGLDAFEWWDGDTEAWPTGPLVEEINIRFVPEGGQRVAALSDGDLDMSYQLSADALDGFNDDEDFRVMAPTGTGFKFMQFPVESDVDSEIQIPEVRQAISALTPRQDIVDLVAGGWGTPARAPIPEPAAGLGTTMEYSELEEQDWSYTVEPDADLAEDLLDDADVETPVEVEIHTNADDEQRQDKMSLLVDDLNASGLFEAELVTPADIGDWTTETLYTEGATEEYAEDNAAAVIGLAAGFDPHGYVEAIHDPDNYNGCCNFFHREGTFDFIDDLRACRYDQAVAEDADLRRERYDDLWPQIVEAAGNVIVDFSAEDLVAGPDVVGANGYPDRRFFLSYPLYAPFDEQVTYLDR